MINFHAKKLKLIFIR